MEIGFREDPLHVRCWFVCIWMVFSSEPKTIKNYVYIILYVEYVLYITAGNPLSLQFWGYNTDTHAHTHTHTNDALVI